MLVRLNPNSSTINVMSVPRDLQVNIPSARRQAAITQRSTLRIRSGARTWWSRRCRQDVFPQLKINHIVDINFAGFRDLVNAIGCVYTDVDHRYFNENIGTASTDYSSINLQAGYQRLCGTDALAYVRYRHTDTDIVRSARQQDFIREAKDQYGQTRLIENRDTLLTIFGHHTQTDPDLHTTDGLINLFNLVAFADGHALREIHFPAILNTCAPPAPCYVSADPSAETRVYRAFMAVTTGGNPVAGKPRVGGRPAPPPGPGAGLQTDVADGQAQVAALGPKRLPVFYPKLIATGASYEGPTPGNYPRPYRIHDPNGRAYEAYRFVVGLNPDMGQYYGVQGMTWPNPPILADPSEIRIVAGRRLELHYDGRKLRLVAWRSAGGVYWISNTLSMDLTNQQMLGIAASLTRG